MSDTRDNFDDDSSFEFDFAHSAERFTDEDPYFYRVNLSNMNLTDVVFPGINLSFFNMSSVVLKGADLRGADLSGANLVRADLRSANLTGANLTGANLEGADLSGANLRMAKLQSARISGADFRGAQLDLTDLRAASSNYWTHMTMMGSRNCFWPNGSTSDDDDRLRQELIELHGKSPWGLDDD